MDNSNMNFVPRNKKLIIYISEEQLLNRLMTEYKKYNESPEGQFQTVSHQIATLVYNTLPRILNGEDDRSLSGTVNDYRELRKKHIEFGQNPKTLDDAFARFTYKLNEIPINLN